MRPEEWRVNSGGNLTGDGAGSLTGTECLHTGQLFFNPHPQPVVLDAVPHHKGLG